MAFEINTLFLLTIDVEAILGLLLLLVWVQNTRVSAVAWWATAHLMTAGSVMLYGLYGSVPDFVAPERRARMFSVFYTGAIGTGAVAPVIYGAIGDALGVATTLIVIACVVLLTLPLSLVLKPLAAPPSV